MSQHGWAARLRRDRLDRGMSYRDLARALIAQDGAYRGYAEDSVERTVKRWESGAVRLPRPAAQDAIARVFGSVRAAYFGVEPAVPVDTVPTEVADDALARLRAAALDPAALDSTTLDTVRTVVDQLCTDYASRPRPVVLDQAGAWLVAVEQVRRQGGVPLRRLTELYDVAGWLTLLVACLRYDAGDETGAEVMRRHAVSLGRDLGSPDIVGWGHEIAAWIALTHGDLRGVLAAVRDGLQEASARPVAVQLHAQAAKAWACVGNRRETAAALEDGRGLLEVTPLPANPRHHFAIDPTKWDFYAMDCARRVGDDALAWSLADTVISTSTTAGGTLLAPMRVTEAELTQAAVEARSGSVVTAVEHAVSALERDRRCLPSLAMVGRDFAAEVDGHPSARDFRQHLAELVPA